MMKVELTVMAKSWEVGQTWANAVHTTVLKLEGDEFGL